MTYTTAQRDALKQAIASGVLRLTYDGKTVEYRSMADLKLALNEVEAALASVRRAVLEEDGEALEEFFRAGRRAREEVIGP